jgi:hypothetical protein
MRREEIVTWTLTRRSRSVTRELGTCGSAGGNFPFLPFPFGRSALLWLRFLLSFCKIDFSHTIAHNIDFGSNNKRFSTPATMSLSIHRSLSNDDDIMSEFMLSAFPTSPLGIDDLAQMAELDDNVPFPIEACEDSRPIDRRSPKTMTFDTTEGIAAMVTPDDGQRNTVEINDPGLAFPVDGMGEAKKSPRAFPAIKNRTGQQSFGVAQDDMIADGEFGRTMTDFARSALMGEKIDDSSMEPIPLQFQATVAPRHHTVETHVAHFLNDEDSANLLQRTTVYHKLQFLLPLPLALKPIVNFLLVMESSDESPAVLGCACDIVVNSIKTIPSSKNDKYLRGEIFESLTRHLASSADMDGHFQESASNDLIDDEMVHEIFFGQDGAVKKKANAVGIFGKNPSFAPSLLQLAVAYGVLHAKSLTKMSMEEFVVDATKTLAGMTEHEQKAFWDVAAAPPSSRVNGTHAFHAWV